MNLDRFTILIEAYGTDPRRWPADERAAAQALLAASTEAQRLLRDADPLDVLLSSPPPAIDPSPALRARIMAQIVARPITIPPWRMQVAEALALLFPTGRMIPQLAALGLALAIGIGAGIANIGSEDSDLITLQLAAATPVYIEE